MRILWITNIILPPLSKELGISSSFGGGWLYASLQSLKTLKPELTFAVATVWESNEFKKLVIDNIVYFLLPLKHKSQSKYNPNLEKHWQSIKQEYKPDIVHIHGSEFAHGLAWINACGNAGVVVSIQGIISEIAKHYLDGVPDNVVKSKTVRDIAKQDSLFQQKLKFQERGELEIELLSKVNHIVGRTDWDKIHCWAINPLAKYHYCGESLRPSFYNHKWEFSKCEPYSIFVSQASYPIKGLHILLKALKIVKFQFNNVKLYVGGQDIISSPWYRITEYGVYIRNLIIELGLTENVVFCGLLDENQMLKNYLNANLFVSPSSIENSANSIAEAQMLGMPIVCSYVGGTPDIVKYDEKVLYRFSDYVMLANKIITIFKADSAPHINRFESSRYDKETNAKILIQIYNEVIEDLR